MQHILLLFLLAPLLAFSADETGLPNADVSKELYPGEKKSTSETAPIAAAKEAKYEPKLWFRNMGEYLATRTTRMGMPTEPTTKLISDGKRYDVGIGKRIPLLVWKGDKEMDGYVFGIDGGMLASLEKFQKNGNLIFATNTFDGFFGAYGGLVSGGWEALLRYAHLSAHFVDNSPMLLNAVSYSQFWVETIVGHSFPAPEVWSDWDLHIQGGIGLNNTSLPKSRRPRTSAGVSLGYSPGGVDDLAIITSADTLKTGVDDQRATYALFLGVGYLNRPQSTHRPFRMGIAHFTGSDYRNQLYFARQRWTTFEISAEF